MIALSQSEVVEAIRYFRAERLEFFERVIKRSVIGRTGGKRTQDADPVKADETRVSIGRLRLAEAMPACDGIVSLTRFYQHRDFGDEG